MNEEQLFEKELARAVKIAVERDYVMLEKDMEGYHHTFSDNFKHKMSLLINQEKKRVKRKRIKIKFKFYLFSYVEIYIYF